MVDAPAEQAAQLHIIAHLGWEREGQHTFDAQRALLLDILEQLLVHMQSMDSTKLDYFLLGGQTVILDDIASVRPDLLTSLVIYNAGGRLGVGPWYIQMDGLLSDGEAIVRNLLIGHADTQRHGVQLMDVAYLPDVCQHTAQLPQILRGFDIDCVFMCLGNPSVNIPFVWEAHDGSNVLAINYQHISDPKDSIEQQQIAQPDGPFLWMHRVDNAADIMPDNIGFNLPVLPKHSKLTTYAEKLREMLPDEFRALFKGEVHMQQHTPISGRFSARIEQKQENSRLQAELSNITEPLLAIAKIHGDLAYPQNQRALLEHSWRLLLQNHARYPMAGAVSDEVQDEIELRNRRIADNSNRVIQSAMTALSGAPMQKGADFREGTIETYVVVWNPHGHAVKQVVEVQLQLPDAKYPTQLLNAADEEVPFAWNKNTQMISFLADVAAVGYSTYTLKLSSQRTADYNQIRTVAGRSIGSASGESLTLNNGMLDWTSHNNHITDLLSFHDGGDAGDIWHYAEPQPDYVMRANLVDVVQVEATPTYERLIFRNRMRIAPGLTDGKSRQRGLKVLDITSTATYYTDVPGIHFSTSFTNTALDHRLRAHIRTGIDTNIIHTDGAFGMLPRVLPEDGTAGSQPMHSAATVYSRVHGVGLFTRGLHEFEPIREDQQITLGLTLLRAVGYLDKANNVQSESAQMQGDYNVEFMLMPLEGIRNPARTLRIAQEYRAPLKAVQYMDKPETLQQSYLTVHSDRVVMTALKPPQKGDGMIVRLLNPSAGDVSVNVESKGKLAKASRVKMNETHDSNMTLENGGVHVELKPYQAVTMRLEYE